MIWAVCISALLFVSITEGQGLSNFPENFVRAGEGEYQVLTCNAAANMNVSWKFMGHDLEKVLMKENYQQEGQNLKVKALDSLTGEYSCWSEGQMLSSVHLLLDANTSDSLFRCRAKSYDCSFSCELTSSKYTAGRMGVGPECTKNLKSCQWVTRSSLQRGEQLVFNLSHSLSPYTEEKNRLEVTAEAIHNNFIVNNTKTFFLREIIQPDSPQIVRCEEIGQQLKVTIKPPPTWSSPHSFFSLEYQIEYVSKDDGQNVSTSSTLIPDSMMISSLRVRCRDSLVPLNWSQWSNSKNVSDFL